MPNITLAIDGGEITNWWFLIPLYTAVNDALSSNKIIIMGTHHDEQISFLQSALSTLVVPVGISYTEVDYPMLINNMAEYHLCLLKNKEINSSDLDQQLLNSKTDTELVDYYSNAFDSMGLLPKSHKSMYDINFNVSDLFNKDAMISKFEFAGLPLTAESLSYYDAWVRLAGPAHRP